MVVEQVRGAIALAACFACVACGAEYTGDATAESNKATCRGLLSAARTPSDTMSVFRLQSGWNGGYNGSVCAKIVGAELAARANK